MGADGTDVVEDAEGRLWLIQRTDTGYEAARVERGSGRTFFRKYEAIRFAVSGGRDDGNSND